MTIKKAIEHFQFKFKNHWKATKTDSEALTKIIDFVNDKHDKQLKQNEMFAKVYIFMYAYFLKHYKTDVFDPVPQKELHKYLDKPLKMIIKRFVETLNESELYTKFNDMGIDLTHPATKVREIKEKELNALKSHPTTFNNVWDYMTVKEQLEIMVNLALNEYS